ncbi:MAG: hypothetical protein EOM41_08170 [Bacilli bacterium]|nr:hypothetical protein [Bacilli bacterium]
MFKRQAVYDRLDQTLNRQEETKGENYLQAYDNYLSEEQRKEVDAEVEMLVAPYSKINATDAAVYVSPRLYRQMMHATGNWGPVQDAAFAYLEQGQDALSDPKDFGKALADLMRPLKMVYFGTTLDTELAISTPVFDKMAVFPLFKAICTGDNKALYDRMHDEKLGRVDMYCFESAVKVGGHEKHKTYKTEKSTNAAGETVETRVLDTDSLFKKSTSRVVDNGTIEKMSLTDECITTSIQDLKNIRLQLNTEMHAHETRGLGTQFAKQAIVNVGSEEMYQVR